MSLLRFSFAIRFCLGFSKPAFLKLITQWFVLDKTHDMNKCESSSYENWIMRRKRGYVEIEKSSWIISAVSLLTTTRKEKDIQNLELEQELLKFHYNGLVFVQQVRTWIKLWNNCDTYVCKYTELHNNVSMHYVILLLFSDLELFWHSNCC
jgi:hypothetical protein